MQLRRLTPTGVQEFLNYLERAKDGSAEGAPVRLLDSDDTSEDLPVDIDIDEAAVFETRNALAVYLNDTLGGVDRSVLDNNVGLWSWLALLYFDQLCPERADGSRNVLGIERYVLNAGSAQSVRLRSYRHLVASPFNIMAIHGRDGARCLLYGPVHQHPDAAEQLASSYEFIANTGLIKACDKLYYDVDNARIKIGATDRHRPGNIRRVKAVLQQLDVTYDIFPLECDQILALLPPEFDGWKTGLN